MSGPEVAVLAGRGKTGRAVCDALERRGARARPLGRERTGASGGALAAALAGADAVYLLAPNLHPGEPRYVARAVAAAQEAGVPRVVYHSVVAPYAPAMPHHLGKARAEDLVRRSGLGWTVVQPCAYVQNFLAGLRADPPRLRVAYDPHARFGLVDLRDVGEAAAAVLLDDDHTGATYELGGPALVSVADVASCAGAVLGREVPLERVSTGQWRGTDGAGTDQRQADWLVAMFDYYDRHGLPAGGRGLATLLGREPTDLPTTLARELSA